MKSEGDSTQSIRDELDRVTADPLFAKANRAARLLRYLVSEQLEGRGDQIKEYGIAVSVFNREDYDPKADSLVRVEAGKLRKLLDKYYASAGSSNPLRIDIPKGAYVPVFVRREIATPRSRRFPAWIAASLLVVLLGAAGARYLSVRHSSRGGKVLSLAVLPIEDMSPDHGLQPLCTGLAEGLIAAMREEGWRMVAASGYHRAGKPARVAGAELDVHAILEGSVRREGSAVRIALQLVNVADGLIVWSKSYDRENTGHLALEKEIVSRVLTELRSEQSHALSALTRKQPANPEAWTRSLQAAGYISNGEAIKAADTFRAAESADPGFAMAWAEEASSLALAVDWHEEEAAKVAERALKAARKAVELDPNLAEAHHALGLTSLLFQRDWALAESEMRRALEIDPGHKNSHTDFARLVLAPQSRFDEAIALLEHDLTLHPKHNNALLEMAEILIEMGRYDEAGKKLDASARIVPDTPAVFLLRGEIELLSGHPRAALPLFEKAVSLRRSPWTLGRLGIAAARAGLTASALRVQSELRQLSAKSPPGYEVALIQAALGDLDAAFRSLDQAVQLSSPALLWINVDPLASAIRKDPRYRALAARLRL